MPYIFKTMLVLLGVVVGGLNPGTGAHLQQVNNHPLSRTTPRNPWQPFEPDFTPSEKIPAHSSARTQQVPTRDKTEPEIRKSDQFKIIKSIDAARKRSTDDEYYLDQPTFTTLNQMMIEAKTGADIAATELSFFLHVKAYLELREEMSNLPLLKQSMLKKYEKNKSKQVLDNTNQDLVTGIKRKFGRELTPRHRSMYFIGTRKQPRYYSELIDFFREDIAQFNNAHFLSIIKEINGRVFQFDYEKLFFVIEKISDTRINQQLPDEAVITAQYAALLIKKETDYTSSDYAFDDIMAIHFPQERFNAAADKSRLGIEGWLSVINVKMPSAIKNRYTHYLTDLLLKKFLQENPQYTARDLAEKFKEFFKNYPELENVYRDCMMIFMARFDNLWSNVTAYIFKTAHYLSGYVDARSILVSVGVAFLGGYVYMRPQQVQPSVQQVREHGNTKHIQKRNVEPNVLSTSSPTVRIEAKINPNENESAIKTPSDTNLSAGAGAGAGAGSGSSSTTTSSASAQNNNSKSSDNPLEQKRNEFMALIHVDHNYIKKSDKAYKDTYEAQKKLFSNSSLSWLSKPNVTKLGDFNRQLILAYRQAGLSDDPETNDILKKLSLKYDIEHENNKAHFATVSQELENDMKKQGDHQDKDEETYTLPQHAVQDQLLNSLIGDQYFPEDYAYLDDDSENQDDDTEIQDEETKSQDASSSSSSTATPVATQFLVQGKTTPVTPYLNAFDNVSNPIAFWHAYKLLIIKFYSNWSEKLEDAGVREYFRTLRNSLAHDDWKLTPDGHVQLYVILISIENIERNGSDKNSKLERLGVALRATLKVPRTQDKSAIDWKVKYQSLCTKIATIYHDYTYSTNKLIHGLALIDLFAELGELLKHPDMNKLIKQAPSPAVTQALTAFINFRDTEYHAGGMPLKQQVEQVQNHYIVLVEYLHHIRNNILPAQNYKA